MSLGTNKNLNWNQTNCPKSGKTRTTQSRLVLVLYLHDWLREWREFSEQNEVKPMQAQINFDIQLKICLVRKHSFSSRLAFYKTTTNKLFARKRILGGELSNDLGV